MKLIILLLTGLLVVNISFAEEALVEGAKITSVEFWGNQFTVYFSKDHSASGCGHKNSAAMDSINNPGKAHMAALLSAYYTNKNINARVTDANCNGDRPTLINFHVF